MAWTRLGLGEGRAGPSLGALLEGEPLDLPVDRMCGQREVGHQGTPTVMVPVARRGSSGAVFGDRKHWRRDLG